MAKALRLGRRDCWFESSRPDPNNFKVLFQYLALLSDLLNVSRETLG